MDEIQDIKRRAGVIEGTTNWDPDLVSRAVAKMTEEVRFVLDQVTHMEGNDKGRAEALTIARELMSNLVQLRKVLRSLREPYTGGAQV